MHELESPKTGQFKAQRSRKGLEIETILQGENRDGMYGAVATISKKKGCSDEHPS